MGAAAALPSILVGGESGQRQRMDICGELVGKCFVHKPLPRDPATAREGRGDDRDGEVRLATGACSLVPDMEMGLILDLEPGRGKPLGQFAADRVGDGHRGTTPSDGSSALRQAALKKEPRLSTTWWIWSPSHPSAPQSA